MDRNYGAHFQNSAPSIVTRAWSKTLCSVQGLLSKLGASESLVSGCSTNSIPNDADWESKHQESHVVQIIGRYVGRERTQLLACGRALSRPHTFHHGQLAHQITEELSTHDLLRLSSHAIFVDNYLEFLHRSFKV